MGQIVSPSMRVATVDTPVDDLRAHELRWLCELDTLYELVLTDGIGETPSSAAALDLRPNWPEAWRPLIQRLATRVGARSVTLGVPVQPPPSQHCAARRLIACPPDHLRHCPPVHALSGSADGFTDEQAREFHAFCSHLHAALSLKDSLDAARGGLNSLHRVIDAMPIGIVLLDEHLQAVLINGHGRDLLARSDALTLEGRHLCLPSQQAAFDDALQAFVADPCRTHHHLALNRLDIQLKKPDAADAPEPHSEVRRVGPTVTRSDVLLLVHGRCEPSRSAPVTEPPAWMAEPLQRCWSLTDKELTLAWNLLQGMSLKHYAASTARSLETVRAQLKSVLRKIGAAGQKDIGLVLFETLHAISLQEAAEQLAAVVADDSASGRSPPAHAGRTAWR